MRNAGKKKIAIRLAASMSLLALTACSGGGGGGGTMAAATGTTSGTTTGATSDTASGSTPTIAVQGATSASLAGNAALVETTPAQFVGWNGTPGGNRSPAPAVGTVFPLQQSVVAYTEVLNSTAVPADSVNGGGATVTYTGLVTMLGVPVQSYELKIPGLGIDVNVPLFHQNVPGTSNGFAVQINALFLNYMMAGNWSAGVNNAGASQYNSMFTTGFQTPVSALPTGGQGIYASNATTTAGSASANIFYTDSGSVQLGVVSGNANISVNFASGAITGTMTNMNAQKQFGVYAGTWNDVGLAGTLSGASVSGSTAVAGPATGSLAFDASSTGTFNGALYGPNGQELGAVWSLHDPTGTGKTALGTIAAVKTN